MEDNKRNYLERLNYLTFDEVQLMHDIISSKKYEVMASERGKTVSNINFRVRGIREFLTSNEPLTSRRKSILKKQKLEANQQVAYNDMLEDLKSDIQQFGYASRILHSSKQIKNIHKTMKSATSNKVNSNTSDNTQDSVSDDASGDTQDSMQVKAQNNEQDKEQNDKSVEVQAETSAEMEDERSNNNQDICGSSESEGMEKDKPSEDDIFTTKKFRNSNLTLNIDILEDAKDNEARHLEELSRQKEEYEQEIEQLRKLVKVGIVYGSFDPITNRDVYLINEAFNIVDKLIIIIDSDNRYKKYRIPANKRRTLVQTAFLGDNRITFMDSFKLVEECMKGDSKYIEIKTLNSNDDTQAIINNYRISRLINSNYKAIYIPIPSEYDCITEEIVYETVKKFGNINNMVPHRVSDLISKMLSA